MILTTLNKGFENFPNPILKSNNKITGSMTTTADIIEISTFIIINHISEQGIENPVGKNAKSLFLLVPNKET